MPGFCIKDKCKINTNKNEDTFVGIKCEDGDYSVNFPLGFHVSDGDKDIRKEIILLMSAIRLTTGKKESTLYNRFLEESYLTFPFQAYLEVIYDYYNKGYYREREVEYCKNTKGKISWNRTIKSQKPTIQDEQVFYLDFISRKSSPNNNELITQIHEYCVYDSFLKIGWLFTDALPLKPRIKFNYKLFKSTVIEKMNHTFNDRSKLLFKNMLSIIDNHGSEDTKDNFKFGTYRFEYVWEQMIDKIFGIADKDLYFPKTKWNLDKIYNNACLEPDSIMILDNNTFILDAKYYKYGQTKNPFDLPGSTSINKQITYGEYAAFKQKQDGNSSGIIYNAFIMPFDALNKLWDSENLFINIGESTSDWKDGNNEYEHIQGILVDVKYLMNLFIHKDKSKSYELSLCIQSSNDKIR